MIITKRSAKRFRRLKVSEIDGAKIHIKYYSQSGLSDYGAVIDFNDYGTLTGNYWMRHVENTDSQIPYNYAKQLSSAIVEYLNGNH